MMLLCGGGGALHQLNCPFSSLSTVEFSKEAALVVVVNRTASTIFSISSTIFTSTTDFHKCV